jgi:hypothetical protein
MNENTDSEKDMPEYQKRQFSTNDLDNLEDVVVRDNTGTVEDTSAVDIADIDKIRELTDNKVIEMASGDLADHIEGVVVGQKDIGKKDAAYYRDIIFALVHIRLPENEAKRDWNEILKHKYTVSKTLGRNVGIHVATLDYYANIKRKDFTPKIIDAHEYVDTASRAILDELTRAYNRSFMEEEFKKLFVTARISGRPFSLIMLDLDHFKVITTPAATYREISR